MNIKCKVCHFCLKIKTKSPFSDSPPEAIAAGQQVKLKITLITSQISPGLSIIGNIWDNKVHSSTGYIKRCRWHFNAESSHITDWIPISAQFGWLNGWMCSSSDILSNDFRSQTISFFITTTLLSFPCYGISPSKVFNCIACLPWDYEWSWCGQRWAADCIVKQPAGCRVSWQAESGLAPSCLAYNWPGEDVKWNLSRVRVMEEKTSHVFIREEMREGREGKTGVLIWYNLGRIRTVFVCYFGCLFTSLIWKICCTVKKKISGSGPLPICPLAMAVKP